MVYFFIGLFIIAFIYNAILVPNNIVVGGVSGLAIIVKELTGLSPKQYLMSVRLKNASVLLLNTDMTVSEIANSVGFPDHSNFIKSFKKIYHVLPKDFRQHQK